MGAHHKSVRDGWARVNPALNEVASRVSCQSLAKEIDKNGCSVGLDSAPSPFLVVDLDHPAAPIKANSVKCDYLFVAQQGTTGLFVVPLELKSSRLNANKVSKQLQGGAKAAENLCKNWSALRFIPVAAQGRKTHRKQFQDLAKKRVVFRNIKHAIVVMDCGSSLVLDEP